MLIMELMMSSDDDRKSTPSPLPTAPSIPAAGMAEGADADVPLPERAEPRSIAVWRQWLTSMASDAEAALAAAIAYREMDDEGRQRWIASLPMDVPEVSVPAVALCAPLLAVESDPDRREQLMDLMASDAEAGQARALNQSFCGNASDGVRVYVLATPLYLDFVQILACGVRDGRFIWVRHDPIVLCDAVPQAGQVFQNVRLEASPMKTVLDELAVAVLSHKKTGESLPDALAILGDLLGALGP
jgi:hypothetical protein